MGIPYPIPNPETAATLLRTDYQSIIYRLLIGSAVGVDYLSLYRPEETEQVYQVMERDGAIIISGCFGIGKSSLLHQILGRAKREGRSVFRPNPRLCIGDNDEEAQRRIISIANHYGFEGKSLTDVISALKEKRTILAIDELIQIFGEGGTKKEYAAFASFINRAAEQDVPMALVIHYMPDVLEKAREAFPFLEEKGVKLHIPRYATRDEIGKVMTSGAVLTAGETPYQPQVLQVQPEAAALVERLAGNKPAFINLFIYEMYNEQTNSHDPIAVITEEAVRDFWEKNKEKIIGPSSIGIYSLTRVLLLGEYYFEDESNKALFQRTFNLPGRDDYLSAESEMKSVPASEIPSELKDEWIKSGLVREENGMVLVDGAITAIGISRKIL